MKRQELINRVAALKEETKTALQAVYDALNHGQQQKLMKDETIKALFIRYGVEVEV